MINRKHIQLHTILLSILLFSGQMSVLVHATEHPFHDSDHLCESFLLAEKSANGLVCDALALTALTTMVAPAAEVANLCFSCLQTAYYARAPPFI